MAILKSVLTPFGVTASYNKIVKAEINATSLVVELMVAIYASAEARALDAPPMWHEYVRIPFSKFTQDPRDLLYPMLAAYGDSYLRGGAPDAEGSGAPGNFTIDLIPEAYFPTVHPGVEGSTPEPAPAPPVPLPPTPPAPPPDTGIPALNDGGTP